MTGVADPALPAGYQFDYINGEVLRDRASVRDGLLTLPHGTQYRLLVLPELETMRPELLTKIARLVRGRGRRARPVSRPFAQPAGDSPAPTCWCVRSLPKCGRRWTE